MKTNTEKLKIVCVDFNKLKRIAVTQMNSSKTHKKWETHISSLLRLNISSLRCLINYYTPFSSAMNKY